MVARRTQAVGKALQGILIERRLSVRDQSDPAESSAGAETCRDSRGICENPG
jgi:hypothetical protein